ncbi:MAG: hypothetical protein EA398_01605 [Deltaproteobacteria bacterium]|nr:MAG: hypothetical protein EA398_01605 [Deltaproteobacteria bacterium]
MASPALPDELLLALEGTSLKLREAGDAVEVTGGTGLQARKAMLTASSVREALDGATLDRSAAAGLARGLQAVLTEPARSKGADLDFTTASASLLLSIEHPLFAAGCTLAGGEAPYTQPLGSDLLLTFHIELDQGYRVVPQSQVERWDVHPERIYRAALSVLFYRSGYGEAEPVEGCPGVTAWRMGDGFDAARILVLDAVDWHRARKGLHVACPSPDVALVADSDDAAAVEALTRLVHDRHESAQHPLSPAVHRYEKAKFVPASAAG